MPIEIRELVIRAQVDPGTGGTDSCSSDGSNNGSNSHRGSADMAGGMGQADLIRACVQEVLRVLEEKQER
jgi:hypothetical protein